MAQTAFIVTGVFVACGEDAGSVFLQQGIVTVDIERTVSPADSQVDSPMRVLLEVVIYGEDVEADKSSPILSLAPKERKSLASRL